jgi:hypothetical protein
MSAGHNEDKGGHGIRTTMTRRDNKRHERSWDTNYHNLTAKVDDDPNQSTNRDMWSSNRSIVLLPFSMTPTMSVIAFGSLLFLMLCRSQLVTALGKAPSISRNKTAVTCRLRHASLILWTRRWTTSVVVLPGLPPKWVAGRSSCFSV